MNMIDYKAKHFNYSVSNGVASLSLTGAEQKNPLTFESYAELRDFFRDLVYSDDINAVILGSNGGNFCSGGNVNDIIGPLVKMSMKELLNFTRMTGDVIKAMINCKKPIIASIDGICVGAGAILAMASDIRIASPEAKTAFLFTRVGLAGCDMVVPVKELEEASMNIAKKIVDGPTFGNMMTKTMLAQEWSMSIEQVIEAEAQAQAICMQTGDFKRAYEAFINKEKPKFEGN